MVFKKAKSNQVHSLIMEQIKDVEVCLASFEEFLRAASNPECGYETLRPLCDDVGKKEYAADTSLHRTIDSLAGTAFLPSSREDIIAIATICDRVANKCESVALMFIYHHFRFPVEYANDLLEILDITHEQFETLKESISQLFSRFGELLKDHSILERIRHYEYQIDLIEHKLYERISAMDLELAYRMQLSQFVEYVCDLSDIIENIADKIQIMLVTRKA